jgi:uncharacterized membrane protein YdjX (TVP38/TMEM64 family)
VKPLSLRKRFLLLRQGLVLLVLGGVLTAYFLFDLGQWFSFEALAARSVGARDLAIEQPFKVVALFLVTLSLVTLFCVPAVAIMQILSGFLFGVLLGTLLSVVAQTIGGLLAFLIARSTFRDSFTRLTGSYLAGLEAGFRANAFTYIVALRMTPVMPYWVVNIAPSLLGVSVMPFLLGTLLGAIPLTFVYATFGTGLGEVIEAGGSPDLKDLVTPRAIALVVVALLFAFAPILLRRWLGRKVSGPRDACKHVQSDHKTIN